MKQSLFVRIVGSLFWNAYHLRLVTPREWVMLAGAATMIGLAVYVVVRGLAGVFT
jgi:hypothetical protein